MHIDDAELPTIIMIGADDIQREHARASWRSFDVLACQCFDKHDKTRILAVAEHPPYLSEPGGYPEWGLGVTGSDVVDLCFAYFSLVLTLYTL